MCYVLARERRVPLAVFFGLGRTDIIVVARDGRIPLAVLDRLGLNGVGVDGFLKMARQYGWGCISRCCPTSQAFRYN